MSNLTITQNFIIQNPEGWVWTVSAEPEGYIAIKLLSSGEMEPTILTMTKEEAYHIANAIKMLT